MMLHCGTSCHLGLRGLHRRRLRIPDLCGMGLRGGRRRGLLDGTGHAGLDVLLGLLPAFMGRIGWQRHLGLAESRLLAPRQFEDALGNMSHHRLVSRLRRHLSLLEQTAHTILRNWRCLRTMQHHHHHQ